MISFGQHHEHNEQGYPDMFQESVLSALFSINPNPSHEHVAGITNLIGLKINNALNWFKHHHSSKKATKKNLKIAPKSTRLKQGNTICLSENMTESDTIYLVM